MQQVQLTLTGTPQEILMYLNAIAQVTPAHLPFVKSQNVTTTHVPTAESVVQVVAKEHPMDVAEDDAEDDAPAATKEKTPRVRRTKAQIEADEAAEAESKKPKKAPKKAEPKVAEQKGATAEDLDTFADELGVGPLVTAKAKPTDEDVRVAFKEHVAKFGYPSAKKIIDRFGVASIKELKPDQYELAIQSAVAANV